MASDAFTRLEETMSAAREAELAAYIMRDVELRQANAKESGVLAYGKRPVPRGRPNERFLQNTLKSVDFANRRKREDEMWERWNRQKRSGESSGSEGQPAALRAWPGKAHRPSQSAQEAERDSFDSDRSSSSTSSGAERESKGQNADLEALLSSRNVRGRGSSGPRADDPGPFLFPTAGQEREEYELMQHTERKVWGPECPGWIRQGNAATDARSLLTAAAGRVSPKVKKEHKAERKEKKKKKKAKKEKEKKRRRKSPSSA